MGSYISIGLIYGKNKIMSDKDILDVVINSLADISSIKRYKYAKDIYGEVWVEGVYSNAYDNEYDKLHRILVSNCYSEITIITSCF
jgi:hypothetical protein